MARWPNLFIVGAAKAGTTSLHQYLSQHPEIYMSSFKEPKFFSQINPLPDHAYFYRYITEEASYLQLFAGATNQKWLGEASTCYLWDAESPAKIKAACPDARIIIMLREPVSRAYSHYLNDVREGIEKRSFLQAVEEDLIADPKGWGVSSLYVDLGLYHRQVERYLMYFGKRVLILFFEEFIKDTSKHLALVFEFLEVDKSYASKIDLEVHNSFAIPKNSYIKQMIATPFLRTLVRNFTPSWMRKELREQLLVKSQKPEMDQEAEQILKKIYHEDKRGLKQILDCSLPW